MAPNLRLRLQSANLNNAFNPKTIEKELDNHFENVEIRGYYVLSNAIPFPSKY